MLILAAGLLTVACQQEQESDKDSAAEKKVDTAQEANQDMSQGQTTAYALGARMAFDIANIQEKFPELELDLNSAKKGFSEQLDKSPKMTKEEITQEIASFQQKLQQLQAAKAKKEGEERIASNKAFLEESLAKGFTKTESGLLYKVVEAGKSDAKPSPVDSVKVHYTGTFTDGNKFDSSVDRGTPFEFSLKGGVIQGWLEGVKLMSVGSKYQFIIPPELAYGPQPRGGIPANSVLVFDIEMLDIIKPKDDTKASEKK